MQRSHALFLEFTGVKIRFPVYTNNIKPFIIKGKSNKRQEQLSYYNTVNALRCLTFERSEHIHD